MKRLSVEDRINAHIHDHIREFTYAYMEANDIDFFQSALDEVREIMEIAINTKVDGEDTV